MKSSKENNISPIEDNQGPYGDLSSRVRARARLLKIDQAEISRRTGIAKSMVGKIWHGKSEPGSTNLIKLAHTLAVPAEWLITGWVTSIEEPNTARLPLVAELGAGPNEGQDIIGEVTIPQKMLTRIPDIRRDIWLVEMPVSTMGDLCEQGDLLICQGSQNPIIERGIFIFDIYGIPAIRRVRRAQGGILLVTDDPREPPLQAFVDGPHGTGFSVRVYARIVGAIRSVPVS